MTPYDPEPKRRGLPPAHDTKHLFSLESRFLCMYRPDLHKAFHSCRENGQIGNHSYLHKAFHSCRRNGQIGNHSYRENDRWATLLRSFEDLSRVISDLSRQTRIS